MKPLILCLLFFLGNSCNESDSVDILETTQNEEVILDQQLLGPNEVIFQIKIVGSLEQNKEICGIAKEHVYQVELTEIIELGTSLNQKLSKAQQMDVAFLFEPSQLQNDMILEAKAKESLCPDASSTYFTVISHKILE